MPWHSSRSALCCPLCCAVLCCAVLRLLLRELAARQSPGCKAAWRPGALSGRHGIGLLICHPAFKLSSSPPTPPTPAACRPSLPPPLQEMRARGIERNVHTYTALMNVCIKCGQYRQALDVFRDMQAEVSLQ